MVFFELPAILVHVYGWNFRILQTINAYQNKENAYEISLKLDEKFMLGISYSGQIVFFQFLHYTYFSSTICPLQMLDFLLGRLFWEQQRGQVHLFFKIYISTKPKVKITS